MPCDNGFFIFWQVRGTMKSAKIPFNWPKSARIHITFVMFLFACVYIFYEIRL